jgi:putative membrane protein
MNPFMKTYLTGAVFAALIAASAVAQQNQSADRMATDSDFLAKAAQGGMAEVELGKLALAHGSSARIKYFGQRMVDDHSKANDKLARIAAQKGVALPTGLTQQDQATKDRLSGLSGAEFDRAYIQDMVKDHNEDIAEFSKEANGGHDPDIRKFASATLPTLREHLKLAERTSTQVGR